MLENSEKKAIGEFTREKSTWLHVASAWIWPGRCEEGANKSHKTQDNFCRAVQICTLSCPVLRSGRMLVCFGVAWDPNDLCDFTLQSPWDGELLVTFSSGESSAEIHEWKLAPARQDLLAQTRCQQKWLLSVTALLARCCPGLLMVLQGSWSCPCSPPRSQSAFSNRLLLFLPSAEMLRQKEGTTRQKESSGRTRNERQDCSVPVHPSLPVHVVQSTIRKLSCSWMPFSPRLPFIFITES